ncbi:MAG TPA: DUF4232 domain-containing protein [Streptosporangiaceae bacterium]
MTGQRRPGHAADGRGPDDLPPPIPRLPRLTRHHDHNVPAAPFFPTDNGLRPCQPGNLSFALGARTSGPRSQTTQTVDLTNQGSSACTMDGFPGMDLVGVARGQQNYRWSLARRSRRYSKVRLQPGGTAPIMSGS